MSKRSSDLCDSPSYICSAKRSRFNDSFSDGTPAFSPAGSIIECRNYIDGRFLQPSASAQNQSDKFLCSENPTTEQAIARVPWCTPYDLNRAFSAAKRAQASWKLLPAPKRASYLCKIASLIRVRRIELATLLAREQSKIISLAQVEIDFTADYFDYYAGWARKYEGEIINSDVPGEDIRLYRCPVGVVLGLIPWNFPFFVMARKVAPTLLVGCTVVIKPSSHTPAICLEMAKIIDEADVPEGVFNIITPSPQAREMLLTHPLIDMISLTGSVETGVSVMKACADNITQCNLELGGKAPALVFADADLELAAEAVLKSRICFSGQVCNCTERLYVDRKIANPFLKLLKNKFEALKIGDPFAEDTAYGSQITKYEQKKLESMVEVAVRNGAKVLTGGNAFQINGKGYFFQPTILTNVKQDSAIIQEETFGPILPVILFDTCDEAIELANDCQFGLASSVFTRDLDTAERVIRDLQFGETYVNRFNFEGLQGYHAGWKKSGIGGADGKHGLFDYLKTKIVYVNRQDPKRL